MSVTHYPEIHTAVVHGFGVTGRAMAKALRAHGVMVVAFDDSVTDEMVSDAIRYDVRLERNVDANKLRELLAVADVYLPSPGVPETHRAFSIAAEMSVPIESEFDLAARWDSRPIVAVTGTDGKTTVTTLIAAMLRESGIDAVECGNLELPLVEAINESRTQVFVVEASSFRLASTRLFRPAVAVWLNFAPDHLDAHESMETYEQAKARIWRDLDGDYGVVVANADEPIVMRNVPEGVPCVTFGLSQASDARCEQGALVLADGTSLVDIDQLPRRFPHDLANALAASTAAQLVGATIEGMRTALRSFTGLPHRVQYVGTLNGSKWYDDSKATTPHAVVSAVQSFSSVILLAGGRNKGLDLRVLNEAVPPVRAVVAIGESADEIAHAFAGHCEVRLAKKSMAEAVRIAAELATAGDAVLLSPGCASFDWYRSYAERGDDFVACAQQIDGFSLGVIR